MLSSSKPPAFAFFPAGAGRPPAQVNRSLGPNGTMSDNGFGIGDLTDDTPQIVAGIVLGALITLIALKGLGFKFVIGVGK